MTRAEAIDLCKNLKLFMEINDKLYANKFLESYHVALSMATNALSEVSELQAINLDLASENENLLEQIQEMKDKAWISVTERLPKEKINPITVDYSEYQCTVRFGNLYDVRSYKYGEGHWRLGAGIVDDYVIAWRELPEPYKEENEE